MKKAAVLHALQELMEVVIQQNLSYMQNAEVYL